MSLVALQEDFHSWLTTEAPDAAERLGGLCLPGLAVYTNNYRGQLMTCLREAYPTVFAWLGGERFKRAAANHIDRSAPRSWTLDAYALDFPATLDMLFPDDPEIPDLARLERDLGLAFIGPDSPPFDAATLGELDWDRAVLDLVPTFSMRSFMTNAAAIWSAINANETPPGAIALGGKVEIAIWRQEFSPMFRTLEPVEHIALTMAAQRETFGEVCAAIVDVVGSDEGPLIAGEFLGQWLRDGMIGSIQG